MYNPTADVGKNILNYIFYQFLSVYYDTLYTKQPSGYRYQECPAIC